MGWFNKKESVPNLPRYPNIPENQRNPSNRDISRAPIAPSLPDYDSVPDYSQNNFQQNSRNPVVIQEIPSRDEETIMNDLPELPSFPNNSKNDRFSRDIVKSAVNDSSYPGEEESDFEDYEFPQTVDASKGEGLIPPRPSIASIPEPPKTKEVFEMKSFRMESPPKTVTNSKKEEPLFVRVDKFQEAQKSLEVIRKKVGDIEEVLRGIKDVKSKEEEELSKWAEEVEKLKSRLSGVDSNLFSQV